MSDKLILRELSRYQLGTFADIIYRNAILYPDHEAFVCGPERMTFRDFNEKVNTLVHGLQASGVQKGDVIGVLAWNCLEYPVVFGAAMKGGYIIAHFSPRLQAEELVAIINDSQAKAVFLGSGMTDVAEKIHTRLPDTELMVVFGEARGPVKAYDGLIAGQSNDEPNVEVTEDDPLVIFYTSGTTGTPRGAIYTHRQKLENGLIKALDLGLEFGDRHLVVLPLFHVGGDSHIWPFFITGGCNVMMPRPSFDPVETLKAITEEKVTDVQIVPTQLVALLNLPGIETYKFPNLKRIWYAASPMPTEVLRQGLTIFGPVFMQGYGQTESGPHMTVLKKVDHIDAGGLPGGPKMLASCGHPSLGVHMRVVDDAGLDVPEGEIGEIIIKSRRIMTGYWRRPRETADTIRDGWLYTGDMGYYDHRGFIYIADRKKDMIITGGENVFPKEVEEVLYHHPAVKEAAVIGIPDKYWVERVHALVVLKDGARATEEDIISFCARHIAKFKTPKGVEFVESLPKSPQGKILKREIRKQYN